MNNWCKVLPCIKFRANRGARCVLCPVLTRVSCLCIRHWSHFDYFHIRLPAFCFFSCDSSLLSHLSPVVILCTNSENIPAWTRECRISIFYICWLAVEQLMGREVLFSALTFKDEFFFLFLFYCSTQLIVKSNRTVEGVTGLVGSFEKWQWRCWHGNEKYERQI